LKSFNLREIFASLISL